MNFLDIILIIVIVTCVIGGTVLLVLNIKDYQSEIDILLCALSFLCAGFATTRFIVIDKASGGVVGIITNVDKNFFGTTAVYLKTTETNEEEYCIEFNPELENKAKEMMGKKVKISYGKRVGLYSTGQCSQAPIDSIELME